MKIRKLMALILVLLLAASPAMAKMTVANKKYKRASTKIARSATRSSSNRANQKTTSNGSAGSTCSNNQSGQGSPINQGTTPITNGTTMSEMAQEVVRQTNSDRAKNGLAPLTVSSELTRAACVRAAEIASVMSHTRPDGSAWSTVSSAARGENIARGQQSADKVMAAWMSSQGHRQNILRESFGSIGVCAYKVGNIMHWVQLFGK